MNIIREAVKKLFPDLAEKPNERSNMLGRKPTPQKRVKKRMGFTKALHEESKARRKMAAASNRINRRNVKRWRH